MKTNKYVEDLNTKSAAELANELVAAKKELFNLRFQNATNQLDNTARIKDQIRSRTGSGISCCQERTFQFEIPERYQPAG